MSNNALISPGYYSGTSFEVILDNAHVVIESDNLDIDIIAAPVQDNLLNPDQLDDNGYFKSQSEALLHASNAVTEYDGMLFLDFFNPGLEMVAYSAEKVGKNLKIASLMHGGSFVNGDLLTSDWLARAEMTWLEINDRIYVPSEYAYSQLPDAFRKKAVVESWGVDSIPPALRTTENRSGGVLFPHRLSMDKGMENFIVIAAALPEVTFTATSPSSAAVSEELRSALQQVPNIELLHFKDRADLHAFMGSSAIVLSCAEQELFGFSVAEAVLNGCTPVLPRGQSYPELYPAAKFYMGNEAAVSTIEDVLNTYSTDAANRYAEIIKGHSIRPLLIDFISLHTS